MKKNDLLLLAAVFLGMIVGGAVSTCNISQSGVKLNCIAFAGQYVNVNMEFKVCQQVPKYSVKIDIDSLGIHIKEEDYAASIAIPLGDFGSLEASVKPSNIEGNVYAAVKINPLDVIGILVYRANIRDPSCNEILYWYNSQWIGVLIVIGVSVVLLLAALCCCVYCCLCRRRKLTHTVKVIHRGMEEFTYDFKIPYSRQQEEA